MFRRDVRSLSRDRLHLLAGKRTSAANGSGQRRKLTPSSPMEALIVFLTNTRFYCKVFKNCLFYSSLTPKGLSPAMSPALQRLVNRTASKYTDKALRASYTPSPAHTGTPGYKTPANGPQTPTTTPQSRTVSQTPVSQDTTSITDNLLQLPKRRKASDFF